MDNHHCLLADLHMHSTASDGRLTPSELMERAAAAGLKAVALTDHDTTAGIDEARETAEKLGMAFLPGIEISTGKGGDIHVLGYGIDPQNEELNAFCAQMKQDRIERIPKMMQKLADIGMPLDPERVMALAKGSVGRPHVARAMVETGYVNDPQEAFARYLGSGMPAYVPRTEVATEEAVRLILKAGGVPVLAHPGDYPDEAKRILEVNEKQGWGLKGIEVYYPHHLENAFEPWLTIACEKALLVTSGSDFHFDGDGHHAAVGEMTRYWKTAEEDTALLMQAVRNNFTQGAENASTR